MVKIVIVDKTGEITDIDVKKLTINDLYKKCNYRKEEGFELRNTWNVDIKKTKYHIELYGKIDVKSKMENKYEMPPPVDNNLYFGNLALVSKDKDNNLIDLSKEEWFVIYKKLYGEFEDLLDTTNEDDMEIDELVKISNEYKTTNGYLKDGFVVEDKDELCNYYDSELDEEEYEYSDDE
jgi:hypothetical protein